MKIDKIKIYFIELILLTILSFALFVSNMYDRIFLAVVLSICAIATWIFIKKRKVESVHTKKVILVLGFLSVIYLMAFYLMGLYFGYYKAPVTFGTKTALNYIIPIGIIIIASEVIRSVLIVQNTKFSKVITFIIMVLVDIVIYTDIYSMTNSYDKFIEIIGCTLFASIACNLLYNYISIRYGITGNIMYRLVTVLYVYIIPYIPNVYIFFRAILRMLYPYIIYQVLEYTFAKNNMIVAYEDKRKNFISKVALSIIAITFAMLISCQFEYGILVIGSGSMTGTINKGDAIFYESYDRQEDVINEGQIIVFNQDDRKIVHRVIDLKRVNDEIRYTTKGDANQKEDDGYITDEDIFGICKSKIPYIGYPSIWIRDMFSN